MKFLNKLLLILCITLAACASNQPIAKTELPASLVSPCEQLEQLQGTTGKDLMQNIVNNAAVYYRCTDKYNALIDAVKSKDK